MGFGWLFIGYFIATLMSINIAGAFIRIVGYGVIFFAASKLNKYNRTFTYLQIATVIMLGVSLLLAASDICGFLYDEMFIKNNIFTESFKRAMGIVEMCVSLVFNGALLYSIRAIAIETEVDKIAVNSVRNFIFICLYFVLNIISYLPFNFVKEYSAVFSLPVLLLYFVWIVLNLILIYSCYARICDENDTEMIRKPSRFSFINKMRAEMEEKENRAIESSKKYRKEKQEKKQNRRK